MRRSWLELSLPGVTGATIFAALAFTPSLLPRDWGLQGMVTGLSSGTGYLVGVFLAWLVRGFTGRTPAPATVRRLRLIVVAIALPVLGISTWLGFQWQVQIHDIMDRPEPGRFAWIPLVGVALAIFVVMVAIGRVVLRFYAWVYGKVRPRVPERVSAPLSALLVLAVIIGVNDGLVWRGFIDAANAVAGRMNNATLDDVQRPSWPQFSGSPTSLIPWATLGKQGRTFVSSAPTTSELRRFSNAPSRRPIRIYAGLRSATSLEAEAALAVRDLERAGGFQRAALVVTAATGTGWVDPWAIRSLEYMYNGNTAAITMQYSYLWSALSFIVDGDKAREASAILFDAVFEKWSSLPEGSRPKLLVTGTSLGAAGAEGAFSGLWDMQHRTDGVVLAGAPVFAKLHAALVRGRDAGSLQRRPVYRGGTVVRFGQQASDWNTSADAWTQPRVLYLQNGSDPIVVWSPAVAFSRPDWMEEPYSSDVLPAMRWIPLVTFWQLSADLPFSLHVGGGHGHNYSAAFPAAWAAVAPPAEWTDADTARLIALLT